MREWKYPAVTSSWTSSLGASVSTDGQVDVREGNVGRGQLDGERVRLPRVDDDAVQAGVPLRRLDRGGIAVDGDDGLEAELGGGDGEHTRAAADVEQAATLELVEEAEAESGRRVRTGPEGAARVDDDRDRTVRRHFPGRADPERADPDGPVELTPALFPAGLDRLRGDVGERCPQTLLTGLVGVDRKLAVALFEAFGMELEQLGSGWLEQVRRDREDDPAELALAQRNALFSLSKNPSSAL